MAITDGPVVVATFNVGNISSKDIRDALRRACREAAHDTVWITGKTGSILGAIVSEDSARFLAEARRCVHDREDE